jgi:hypothetical protein
MLLVWISKINLWLCTSVITALRWLRQEDCEFKASLGYVARPLKKYIKKQMNMLLKCNYKYFLDCFPFELY